MTEEEIRKLIEIEAEKLAKERSSKGGRNAAKKMTPEERTNRAKKAAATRWKRPQ